MTRTAETFAYDAVFYPGHPFEQTHPDRLATIASLFGMEPAPVDRCRVLELGCGLGGNLLPMAYELPDSEFIGIDLSAPTIARGASNVARLGLSNISLRHCDILDVGEDVGRFDYIIAHGVYSWVPQAVRDRMLAIFRDNLSPHGVAYVSYNAYPGSHFRDLTREMMLHHVSGIEDPKQRIAQSRALMKLLAETTPEDKPYGIVMREQFERVSKMPDEVLYHDDLNAGARAFFVRQVAEDAARAGLQYLSEANVAHTSFGGHGEKVAQVLQQISEEHFIEREQYLDFLVGRGFRESLLCRGGIALRRDLKPSCVTDYWISAPVHDDGGIDPTAEGVVTVKVGKGASISTDHRLSKMALLLLAAAWPRAIRFDDLAAQALDQLAARGTVAADREAEIEALATVLFRAFCYDHVSLHRYPPRLTTTIAERPQASLLARREAESGPLVTTLRHSLLYLEDATVRRFLGLVDGTRTVADMTAALNDGGAGKDSPPVTPESVARNLTMLAKLGLLVA
jgi:SAM-dependent methyltransferase